MPAKQNKVPKQKKQPKRKPLTRKAKASLRRKRQQVGAAVGVNTKQFQALMNTLTLPHDTPAVRYPIAGFAKKTASKKLYAEFNYQMNLGDTTYWPVLLTRSPVHPVWTLVDYPVGALIHQWDCYIVVDGLYPQLAISSLKLGVGFTYPGLLDSFQPAACLRQLIYVPANATLRVQIGSASSSGHSAKLHFEGVRSLGGAKANFIYDMTIALSGGGGIDEITMTTGVWLKLDRFVTADSSGGSIPTVIGTQVILTVMNANTDKIYCLCPTFQPISQAAISTLMSETRITASSLLLTNVTPKLYRGGRIDAAAVDYEQDNVFDLAGFADMVLSRHNDLRYMGPGEKGLYMYSLPTEKTQQLSNYFPPMTLEIDSTGTIVPPYALVVPLEDFQLPTAGLFAMASEGATTQTFACYYDQHLEAVTTDQVWDIATAEPWLTPDLYQKMLTALANLPPACENPGHWDKLKSFVKKAFLFAKPELASLVGRMATLALH